MGIRLNVWGSKLLRREEERVDLGNFPKGKIGGFPPHNDSELLRWTPPTRDRKPGIAKEQRTIALTAFLSLIRDLEGHRVLCPCIRSCYGGEVPPCLGQVTLLT